MDPPCRPCPWRWNCRPTRVMRCAISTHKRRRSSLRIMSWIWMQNGKNQIGKCAGHNRWRSYTTESQALLSADDERRACSLPPSFLVCDGSCYLLHGTCVSQAHFLTFDRTNLLHCHINEPSAVSWFLSSNKTNILVSMRPRMLDRFGTRWKKDNGSGTRPWTTGNYSFVALRSIDLCLYSGAC